MWTLAQISSIMTGGGWGAFTNVANAVIFELNKHNHDDLEIYGEKPSNPSIQLARSLEA